MSGDATPVAPLTPTDAPSLLPRHEVGALYVVVLVLAATGLAYELALGAAESFLIGDPIVLFALIISGYMAALGLGAYLSEWVHERLEVRFIDAAIATAALGGISAPALYVVFGLQGPFRLVLYAETLVIGSLVGVQLPLLMRILKTRERFADVVGRAFAFDYAGALFGSLGFSLLLLPNVGLARTTLTLGLLNLAAASYVMRRLGRQQPGMRLRSLVAAGVAAGLMVVLLFADRVEALTELPL